MIKIFKEQVESAVKVYELASELQNIEKALKKVRNTFPDFTVQSVLVKVAVVNSLYNTNIFRVYDVAHHISELIAQDGIVIEPEFVDKLSVVVLKNNGDEGKEKHYISFTSVLAHTFLSEKFPIYNSVIARMVGYHVHEEIKGNKKYATYSDFYHDFYMLLNSLDFKTSVFDLHRYLWISGEYRKYSGFRPWENPNNEINPDLKKVFKKKGEDIQLLLKDLVKDLYGPLFLE
ncbi:hypothetical protein SAMN04488510_10490 [Fervidobacterium changbaicum]|uniref:Uncharacterized protein n=2 Tax=Fervidobacterium TaxID=2422 RepID=A0AAI8GDQ2_FERIS|nr:MULTISPECIES: hypothetical protein [Fervidobacterium]AMW33257.1 hypothetical protein NA23_08410 [Fervidobacterium islandicum]QAV33319.1 hypothetical protein CBS1_06000 [Fervidobacterium changbaicum]SDH08537.1 hypothetical protein SAMN04488510_10490 [Fervidobacterium changbaicum]